MIEAEIQGDAWFMRFGHNFVVASNVAFRRMADDVVTTAKGNIDPDKSGLHNRTGTLRDSIKLRRFQQLSPGGQAEAVIAAGNARTPGVNAHEYGAIIRPRRAEYLTFQIAGRWVKTKQVVIPKRSFLSPAVDEAQQRYDRHFSDAFDDLMRQL